MNHEEANTGRVNPNYGKAGFGINCSTCSGTYILRRMGFDVQAKANIRSNINVKKLSKGYTTWEKWIDGENQYVKTRDWMRANNVSSMTKSDYIKFINDNTQTPGIYEFNVGYANRGGHSTLLMRKTDGTLERIEQQVQKKSATLENLLNSLESIPHRVSGIYRVDDKMFNSYFADIVKKTVK